MNQRIMTVLYLSSIVSILVFAPMPICAKRTSEYTTENVRSSGCSSDCNHCHEPAPNGFVDLSMQNCISCNENKDEKHLSFETNYPISLSNKQMCRTFSEFDAANFPQVINPSKLVLVQNPAFNPPLTPGQPAANPPVVDPSIALSVVGKNVVIVGGAKNIGKAIAELFFAEGANVTATSRNPKCYEKPPYTLKKLDVRYGDDVNRFIEKYIKKNGHIDILILMPAVDWHGPLAKATGGDMLTYLNSQLVGFQRVVHYALPHMRHSDETRVISFGSAQAYTIEFAQYWNSLYCITKRALQTWNDCLQLEEMFSKAQGFTQFGPTFSLLEPAFVTSTLGLYEACKPSSLKDNDPLVVMGSIAVAPDQSLGGGIFAAIFSTPPYTPQFAAFLTLQVAIAPQPGVRYILAGNNVINAIAGGNLESANDTLNLFTSLASAFSSTANLVFAKQELLQDLCS